MAARLQHLARLCFACIFVAAFASPSTASAFATRVRHLAGTGEDWVQGMRVDSSGNLYVAGEFTGSITIDGQTRTSAGGYDIYLAKFSASDSLIWLKSFGGSGDDQGLSLELDSTGNVLLAGYFEDSISFGGKTLRSSGERDAFLAKFNSAGVHQWSEAHGGSQDDWALYLAVGASNEIYLAGGFESARANFGNKRIDRVGDFDGFVVRFASDGKVTWAKGLNSGDANDETEALAVVADGSGGIFIAGYAEGALNVTKPGDARGPPKPFQSYVAKISAADGALVWQKAYPCTTWCAPTSLARDASGNLFLAGIFEGSITLGNTVLSSDGRSDLFLARVAASDGMPAWTKSFGGPENDWGISVRAASNNAIYVATTIAGEMNFGGATLTPPAGQSAIGLARYNAAGTHVWSAMYAGGGAGSGAGYEGEGFVQYNASENKLHVGGWFLQNITVESTTYTSRGSWDGILITRDP